MRAKRVHLKPQIVSRGGVRLNMFQIPLRRAERSVALKQLRKHLIQFGVLVALIRVTPYVLSAFQKDAPRN